MRLRCFTKAGLKAGSSGKPVRGSLGGRIVLMKQEIASCEVVSFEALS